MTTSLPQRTLGELRRELRTRLGFATQGAAAERNRDVLNSFLQEAQDYLAHSLSFPTRRLFVEMATVPGSTRYDWHDSHTDTAIDPANVQAVWIVPGEAQRTPLQYGIDEPQRAQTHRSMPCRYDTFNGQLEVWPTPDARYQLVVQTITPLPRFTQDRDRTHLPDRLLVLYALAAAKAHYRHPDAAVAGKAFETLCAHYRAKQHGVQRYFARAIPSGAAQVVRTAHGYFLG